MLLFPSLLWLTLPHFPSFSFLPYLLLRFFLSSYLISSPLFSFTLFYFHLGDEMADIDIIRAPSVKAGEEIDSENKIKSKKQADNNEDEDKLFVLMVTEKGYGKRIVMDEFKVQKKGGKGVTAIKFKDKAGGGGKIARKEGISDGDAVSCMRVCRSGDEVVLSTSKGTVIRQSVDDLSVQSRLATGVLIQKIAKDDKITMVDIVIQSATTEFVLA